MSVLASDNFNRANNADVGANWTPVTGFSSAQIVGNRVQASATGVDVAERYSGISWPNDQYSQCVAATVESGSNVGPCVRLSAAAMTGYVTSCESAQSTLYRVNAGDFNAIGTGAGIVAGDVLRLEAQGDQITLFVNAVTRIGPITNSDIASGSAGIGLFVDTLANGEIDDWQGGDFVAAGGQSPRSQHQFRRRRM
jgi:hypothetical protein